MTVRDSPRGVNVLVVEFNYQFDFQSRAEFGFPRAVNRDDVRALAATHVGVILTLGRAYQAARTAERGPSGTMAARPS